MSLFSTVLPNPIGTTPFLAALVGLAVMTLLGTRMVRTDARRRGLSKRERTEQALRESEQRWQLAVEGSNDGIWDWNLVAGTHYFSERWKSMLGFAPDEILPDGKEWSRRIHPDDVVRVEDRIQQHLTGASPFYQCEYRIRCKDGSYKWVLARGRALFDDQGQPLRMVGSHTDTDQRRRHEAEARRLGYLDRLTGLPNLSSLLETLTGRLREGRQAGTFGSMLFIDVDHFQRINDVLGHGVGDRFLRDVARRLSGTLQEGDLLARLGGDKFVILLRPVLPSLDAAREAGLQRAAALRRALLKPCGEGKHSYVCTGSVGVTLYPATLQSNFDVLREADIAMYRAKEGGRDRAVCFEPAMQIEIQDQLTLEQDLHVALAAGQLELHLQGQFDQHGRLRSAEALLRWRHPENGMIPPGRFIPVAETCSLIVPIGAWVIEQVAILLVDLARTGRLVPIAVNVSVRQFMDDHFVATVLDILARHPPPAGHLVMEVTESLLANRVEHVCRQMDLLVEAGIRFSLDDFGTGYSSLAFLKALPVEEIKIDQSFVQDIGADKHQRSIIPAILAMARALGVAVIAEGVETLQQRTFLAEAGCQRMQGFLFARPEPVAEWRRQLPGRLAGQLSD